jgi:hypothetical protein
MELKNELWEVDFDSTTSDEEVESTKAKKERASD